MASRFERCLEIGRIGEQMVCEFLQSLGCGVVPSYEFSGEGGSKAPRMMFSDGGLVIPDVDASKMGKRRWVEVKTYASPERFRSLGFDIHGIKRRHYQDYLRVEDASGCDVYLAVLEIESGSLLASRLRSLRAYGCMCRNCQQGLPGSGCLVYFRRDAFHEWHRFTDAEMDRLRRAHVVAA